MGRWGMGFGFRVWGLRAFGARGLRGFGFTAGCGALRFGGWGSGFSDTVTLTADMPPWNKVLGGFGVWFRSMLPDRLVSRTSTV